MEAGASPPTPIEGAEGHPLPRPLADVLRALRWWWYRFQALVAAALTVLLLAYSGQDVLVGFVILCVGFLLGVAPPLVTAELLVPRDCPDFLYLRTFRSDAGSLRVKHLLEVLVGSAHRLAGIRAPRRRVPAWLKIPLAPALQFAYSSPKHMGLEAGSDWPARLWASLASCRGVFIDVRQMTGAVTLEVRLSHQALGLARIGFLVDDSRPSSAWKDAIAEMLGLGDGERASIRLLPWTEDAERPESEFAGEVRGFVAATGSGAAGPSALAYPLVAPYVKTAAARKREAAGIAAGLLLGLLLVGGLSLALEPLLGQVGAQRVDVGVTGCIWLLSLAYGWRHCGYLGRLRGLARAFDPPYAAALGRRRRRILLLQVAPVLAFVLGLLVMIGPNTWEALSSNTRAIVEMQQKNFSTSIGMYYMDRRELPDSLQDLTSPSEKDNEPFLDTIPQDPWGSDYDYQVMNRRKREFEIRSAGEDKILGTEDDIVFRSADAGRDR